jgi:hypothetical protein
VESDFDRSPAADNWSPPEPQPIYRDEPREPAPSASEPEPAPVRSEDERQTG